MPALLLNRFFRARTLSKLRPETLRLLLTEYTALLQVLGLDLNRLDDPEDFEFHESLSHLIENPESGFPESFYLGLEQVRRLVLREDFMDIHERAIIRGFEIEGEPTDMDIGLRLWMWNPAFVEAALASESPSPNSFVVFRTHDDTIPTYPPATPELIETFSTHICHWLMRHKRGDFCDVKVDETEDEVSWTITHGHLYQVQEIIREGRRERTLQRPIEHDLIIFRKRTGDLHIHLPRISMRQLNLYREGIGLYFFGLGNQFSDLSSYDLSPLQLLREQALDCSDIPDIRYVKLEYLEAYVPGASGNEFSFKDKHDFFATIRRRESLEQELFGPGVLLRTARFIFRFRNNPKEYKLTVRAPNNHNWREPELAHLVEEWLLLRGFLKLEQQREQHEQLEMLLPISRAS